MKRTFIVIGVMCIIAGVVAVIGGFSAAGWDRAKLDPVPYETKVFDSEKLESGQTFDGLASVSVTARGRVEFVRGDAFRVDYSESEYFRYDVSYKAGSFNIEFVELKPYIFQIDLFGSTSIKFRVTVTLPRDAVVDAYVKTENSSATITGGTYKAIDVESTNGSLWIEDLTAGTVRAKTSNASMNIKRVTADKVTAVTANGSLRMEESKADTIALSTRNASLKIEGVTAARLDADTTNGSLTAADATVSGGMYLNTTSGSLRVERAKAVEIRAETSNASLRLYDVGAQTVWGKTANGSIRVENLLGDDITLKTTNASVKGTIRGSKEQFTVVSQTSPGNTNDLGNGGNGHKQLTVTTTNGSIKIEFAA